MIKFRLDQLITHSPPVENNTSNPRVNYHFTSFSPPPNTVDRRPAYFGQTEQWSEWMWECLFSKNLSIMVSSIWKCKCKSKTVYSYIHALLTSQALGLLFFFHTIEWNLMPKDTPPFVMHVIWGIKYCIISVSWCLLV